MTANVRDLYALSPLQEGMLFHARMAPESGVFVEQRWCTIGGPLRAGDFAAAWQSLTGRHDLLRTEFHWEDLDDPVQVLYDSATLPWVEHDWRDFDEGEAQRRFEAFLAADRARGFELDRAPLMRCALFQIADERFYFAWTYHHLLFDGWCNALLLREVLAHYFNESEAFNALPEPFAYRRFIEWLAGRDQELMLEYWREELAGIESPSVLDLARPVALPKRAYSVYESSIDVATSQLIREFCRQHRLTLNTLVQGAWALTLAHFSDEADVVFGAVLAGRPAELSEAQSAIGLFINTVPVRVQTDAEISVVEWLSAVQNAQRDREFHGHASLGEVQALSDVPNGSALFDTLLVFENYPFTIDAALGDIGELNLSELAGYERTNYPVTLVVIPSDAITLSLRYNAERFDDEAVAQLLAHFAYLLERLCEQATARVSDFSASAAREQVVEQNIGAGPDLDIEPPNFDLLRRATVAADNKQLIAPANAGSSATVAIAYQRLGERVDDIAAAIAAEIETESQPRIGIYLTRSAELLASLLAAMKLGATYVPLAQEFPDERLRYMAADADLDLLIFERDPGPLASNDCAQLDLSNIAHGAVTLPSRVIDSDSVAYLMYTSGSTGRPKGVAVTYRNLWNFIAAMKSCLDLGADERLLAVTTISFDIAALELYLPLSVGARLVIASSEEARDPARLAALIETHGITVMQATPATWRLLIEVDWQPPEGFKILCGGEALDTELARELLARGSQLWNLYGPTETTVWSAALRVEPAHCTGAVVPIGLPIANTQFAVLNRRGERTPFGAVGELAIGGQGVAQGYWRRQSLSDERFVEIDRDADASHDARPRYYRTGDRVRYRPDGLLDFLGRDDGQVKIRGYRIELGEIEAELMSTAGVAQAVAAVHQDLGGGGQLLAWIVERGQAPDPEELRERLGTKLPNYMIPIRITVVSRLPLNNSGKVDRAALLALADSATESKSTNLRRSPQGSLIAGVWEDILHVEAVDDEADFFRLGGHSLTAARMMARVAEITGETPPLTTLFQQPRFGDFVAAVEKFSVGTLAPIERQDYVGVRRPISAAQVRQYLLAHLIADPSLYGIPTAVRLQGRLNLLALGEALQEVVARHEPLRMRFGQREGQPYAEVVAVDEIAAALAFSTSDLSHLAANEQSSALDAALKNAATADFDLAQAPLWQTRVIKLDEQEHVFIFSLHHIVADGWSLGILVKELGLAYERHSTGSGSAFAPLRLSYADYACWEANEDHKPHLDYWCSQLSGAPTQIELPTDFARPPEQSFEGARCEFEIPASLAGALRGCNRRHGVTLYMSLAAAYALLLSRFGAGRDFVIGTPLANRIHSEFEDLIGLFANTVALRFRLAPGISVAELMTQTRDLTLEAIAHQAAPFDRVLEALDVPRSRAAAPLFQTLFTLQNAPFDPVEIEGVEWVPERFEPPNAKFDLSLSIREDGQRLVGQFDYRTDLFTAPTVNRLSQCYLNALQAIALAEPDDHALSLNMLAERERQSLRQLGDLGAALVANEDTIQGTFERQARRTPHAVALRVGDRDVSYQALNQMADRVGAGLQAKGVATDDCIGVLATPTIDAVVNILGVLKAGGAYVPLDNSQGAERLAWIAKHVRMKFAVCADASDNLLDVGVPWVGHKELSGEAAALTIPGHCEQLAYIMHTSGSTGEPKSVAARHRGVLRLVRAQSYATFGAGQVHLLAAPLGFDAATFELWGALLNGGTVALPAAEMTLESLADDIERHRVTTLWLTAGLFHVLIDQLRAESLQARKFATLQELIAGGDVLSISHLRRASKVLPHVSLVNGYGPTENTTFSVCHRFSRDELNVAHDKLPVPIGEAITGTRIYVLDDEMGLVPDGVAGELYLGGSGLARGYLNQARLTAESFVPNPYFNLRDGVGSDDEITLYRTGDRVRRRADGALEFLGRFDEQVKVRGFRIEPREVERLLGDYPGVTDAVVQVHGSGAEHKRLVAYLVGEALPGAEDLRTSLSERLPHHLVPNAFIVLDAFPLGATGKVDRAALPEPEFGKKVHGSPPPSNEREAHIINIATRILPAKVVALDDNFFELGGDSIMALQMVSEAQRVGLTITPKQIFEAASFGALATFAERDGGQDRIFTKAQGEVPLTPIQHWFFAQNHENPNHFNQALSVMLPENVERESLDRAFLALGEQHDALRLRFSKDRDHWRQFYDLSARLQPPSWHELSHLEPDALVPALNTLADSQHSAFRLADGPLCTAAVFSLGPGRGYQLLLVAHHLVIDVVSWRILIADLYTNYQSLEMGQAPGPRLSEHTYQNYAKRLAASHSYFAADLAAWREIIENTKSVLPKDSEEDIAYSDFGNSQRYEWRLEVEKTLALLTLGRQASKFDVQTIILAALGGVLCEWAECSRFLIDIESHGREESAQAYAGTLGWFTAIAPLQLESAGRSNPSQRLQAVQARLDAVPERAGFGVLKYLSEELGSDVQPSVVFNYLGHIDSVIDEPAGSFARVPAVGSPHDVRNVRPYLLEISARIENSELWVLWDFDRRVHSVKTMERLSVGLHQEIGKLVAGGAGVDGQGRTPSFELVDLSASELDEIMSSVSFDSPD
ncbi:MAG: amino acid adenylation domain-containing protein [Pseudomonadota bacterium]